MNVGTHSAKDISPSLLVSKSRKNSEGAHCKSPRDHSPLKLPTLTWLSSAGGNTGTKMN